MPNSSRSTCRKSRCRSLLPDGTVQSLVLAADQDAQGDVQPANSRPCRKERTGWSCPCRAATIEPLSRRSQVKVPDLERENPHATTPAERTGPAHWRSVLRGSRFGAGPAGHAGRCAQLKDRTEVTYLAGVKDLEFEDGLDVDPAGRDLRRTAWNGPFADCRNWHEHHRRTKPSRPSAPAWTQSSRLGVRSGLMSGRTGSRSDDRIGIGLLVSLAFDWLLEPPRGRCGSWHW